MQPTALSVVAKNGALWGALTAAMSTVCLQPRGLVRAAIEYCRNFPLFEILYQRFITRIFCVIGVAALIGTTTGGMVAVMAKVITNKITGDTERRHTPAVPTEDALRRDQDARSRDGRDVEPLEAEISDDHAEKRRLNIIAVIAAYLVTAARDERIDVGSQTIAGLATELLL